MRLSIPFLLLLMAGLQATAQDFKSFWAFDHDNVVNPFSTAWPTRIEGDTLENVFVIGWADTTFNANPAGSNMVTVSTTEEAYVIKYDSAGNYLWHLNPLYFGTPREIASAGPGGDLWLGGRFAGPKDLDLGPGVANYGPHTIGDEDAFLAHYDSNGNLDTAFVLGGGGADQISNLHVDADGNILVVGQLQDTLDLDPGPGTHLFTQQGANRDSWIAKYTPTGTLLWARQIAGNPISTLAPGMEIVVPSADGGAFVASRYSQTITFDPVTNPVVVTAPWNQSWQWFIAQYGPTGDLLWQQTINSTGIGFGHIWDIEADANNNVYIAMSANDSTDLDPDAGTYWIDPINGTGVLAKYNAAGQFDWAGQYVTSASAQLTAVEVDQLGRVYAMGGFITDVQLDFSGTASPITAPSGQHIFRAVYDTDGNALWHHITGPATLFTTIDQWLAPSGNAYSLGAIIGTADVNPGSGTQLLDGTGEGSGWVHKWRACLPAIVSAPTTDVCAGDPFSMSISGYPTINWSNGYANGSTISLTSSNSYTATVSDAWGCSRDTSVSIAVVQPPTLIVSSTGDTICSGDSVTLSAATSGTLAWSGGITNATPFAPSASTVYYASASGNAACSAVVDSVLVTVASAQLSTSVSANNVCEGTPVTLTASGATTINWDQGVINGQPFAATNTQTYTATGSNAQGCTDTTSVLLTVLPVPQLVISSSADSVCNGESSTFTASGAPTISWDQGVVNGQPFVASNTQTYTAIGTNVQGCNDTAAVHLTVLAVPQITISSSTDSACAGENITLTASGASTINWDQGVINGQPFAATITQTYTATASNAQGCSATDVITVTVTQGPQLTISSSASSVCAGENVTLTATGANSVTWDQGVSNGIAFPLSATQTFTATGTNGTSCSATNTITIEAVEVNVLAQATPASICPGEESTIIAFGADSYQWDSGLPNGSLVSPAQTTTYTVIGNSSPGCTDTSSVTLVVHTLPVVAFSAFSPDTYCNIDSLVSMPQAAPAGGSFSGPGLVGDFFSLSLAGVGSHNIVYSIQTNDGCTASDTSVVNVDICNGIEGIAGRSTLHFYPNPAREYIVLETRTSFSNTTRVELLELNGKVVQQWMLGRAGNREVLPLNNIAAGMYLLQVQDATQMHTVHIVVE